MLVVTVMQSNEELSDRQAAAAVERGVIGPMRLVRDSPPRASTSPEQLRSRSEPADTGPKSTQQMVGATIRIVFSQSGGARTSEQWERVAEASVVG